jgi:(1->4)-alpha-D-glucan 1-alpha-D-glucosylmutase
MLRVCGLFVDPEGEAPLTALYTQLTGEPAEFAPVVEQAKRDVVEHGLYAEVQRLVELAAQVCHDDLLIRDHTRRGLREAFVELLVAFPVYRAYVTPGEEAPPESVRTVEAAAEVARKRLPEERHATLDLVRDLVLGRPVGDGRRERRRDELVVRFQQTCGPVMAKGVEDTAFYRWFRLSGLNEVGGDPEHFGVPVEQFHAWTAASHARWPGAMTTLSTHDTKRSEDVRARLAVLSQLPQQWGEALTSWRALSAPFRPARLDANTEYLLWQTLVGAWPLDAPRLTAYLEKATREAKQRTTWTTPDEEYDAAVRGFAEAVLASDELRAAVGGFVAAVEPHVRAVVLGQKLVQLVMPGAPDVYQGTELVDLSLVDPDNRRPVDYARRRALLERLDAGEAPQGLDMEKLLVVSRALRLRRDHPDRTGPGASYEPVPTTSPHAVAFARGGSVVAVATRMPVAVERQGGWGGATVALPPGTWRDVLGGPEGGPSYEGGDVPLATLLSTLPVALLVRS